MSHLDNMSTSSYVGAEDRNIADLTRRFVMRGDFCHLCHGSPPLLAHGPKECERCRLGLRVVELEA